MWTPFWVRAALLSWPKDELDHAAPWCPGRFDTGRWGYEDRYSPDFGPFGDFCFARCTLFIALVVRSLSLWFHRVS